MLSKSERAAIHAYKSYHKKCFGDNTALWDLVVPDFDASVYKTSGSELDALQEYLKETEPQVKALTTSASLRQRHYERYIAAVKDRMEEEGHQTFRMALNVVAEEAQRVFERWQQRYQALMNQVAEEFEASCQTDPLARFQHILCLSAPGKQAKESKTVSVGKISRPRLSKAERKRRAKILAEARSKDEHAFLDALQAECERERELARSHALQSHTDGAMDPNQVIADLMDVALTGLTYCAAYDSPHPPLPITKRTRIGLTMAFFFAFQCKHIETPKYLVARLHDFVMCSELWGEWRFDLYKLFMVQELPLEPFNPDGKLHLVFLTIVSMFYSPKQLLEITRDCRVPPQEGFVKLAVRYWLRAVYAGHSLRLERLIYGIEYVKSKGYDPHVAFRGLDINKLLTDPVKNLNGKHKYGGYVVDIRQVPFKQSWEKQCVKLKQLL